MQEGTLWNNWFVYQNDVRTSA